ncbi:Tryptophan-rich protein TspO [bioreactor metagenome]|uniref:Tryptophan-rich protein TspO n=1 Tax=bioreactor metagenome TaxID=1076179 RepID=A0A645CHG7_9ZZZZ
MKRSKINLVISILIPLFVGQLAGLLTGNCMDSYYELTKSPLTPPSIVFPIVWTILYILMGISSYLIYISDDKNSKNALIWYGIQLFLNFIWSIIFFCFSNYVLALICLIILIICIVIMITKFYDISPIAAYLQLPYLLWCLFAAYLNLSIILLN